MTEDARVTIGRIAALLASVMEALEEHGGLIAAESELCDVLKNLTALRQQITWQPIETAPTDGTEVLITAWIQNRPDMDRYAAVCSWHVLHQQWMINGEEEIFSYPPTHWMPLPVFPQGDKA